MLRIEFDGPFEVATGSLCPFGGPLIHPVKVQVTELVPDLGTVGNQPGRRFPAPNPVGDRGALGVVGSESRLQVGTVAFAEAVPMSPRERQRARGGAEPVGRRVGPRDRGQGERRVDLDRPTEVFAGIEELGSLELLTTEQIFAQRLGRRARELVETLLVLAG